MCKKYDLLIVFFRFPGKPSNSNSNIVHLSWIFLPKPTLRLLLMKQLPRVYDVFFLPRVRLDVSSSSVRSGGPLAQLGKTHQRHTSLHPRFDQSLQQTLTISTRASAKRDFLESPEKILLT